MSLSNILNKILNKLYKIAAILLVVVAVLLSGLRLFLPYAEDYKLDVQNYLNEKYQGQIVIGNLSAGWQKLGPTLIAENVSVVNSNFVNIFIDKIDFSLDIWGSITARQIITNDFTLEGTKVSLDRSALINNDDLGDSSQLLESLGDLFLSQVSRFTLRDSQLVFITPEKKQRTIFIENLLWRNKQEHHQGIGEIVFDGISSNNVQLQLDLSGKKLTDVNGQLYLSANNLDISPWLSQMMPMNSTHNKTDINFQTWLSIEKGKQTRIQTVFGENKIKWQYANQPHIIHFSKGQILLESDNNFIDYQLYSSPLEIKFDDTLWQPVTIQAGKQSDNRQFYSSFADIASVSQLIPFIISDKALVDQIQQLKLTGEVSDIYVRSSAKDKQLSLQINELSNQYANGIPGVQHISGNLIATNKQAQFLMHLDQGQLDFGKLFEQPLPYQSVSAVVDINYLNNQWAVTANDINWQSNELNVTGDFKLFGGKDTDTSMSILAQIDNLNVKNAAHYYPQLLMGKDLVNYLNRSIHSGVVERADVLFNGKLSNFPFVDNSGIFVVDANLIDSDFSFDPDWPVIKQLNANLNFTNNSMLITAKSGRLSGLDVKGVTAGIAELRGQGVLEVTAPIKQAKPQQLANLMINSPLVDSVGATLKIVKVQQPVDGNFQLTIPLNNSEATVAKGNIFFANNAIALSSPELFFDDVNGQLSFENDVISTTNIQANWHKLPLIISVKTENKADYFLTSLALDGNWQQQQYQPLIPKPLRKYINNEVDWHGDLSLFMPHDGEFSYQFTVNTPLQKTALELPAPFAKPAEKPTKLTATVNGRKDQSTIEASLGEQLSFFGVLNHQQKRFVRAHLLIGHEQMLLPMNGFHITANLADAKVSEWHPFIVDILNSLPSETASMPLSENSDVTTSLFDKPKRIRGNVTQLDVLGETLHDVSFNLLDQNNWWLLQLNAKEARTEIKFYPDLVHQGIAVNADFIHLPESLPEKNKPDSIAKSSNKPNDGVAITETTKKMPNADIENIFNNIPLVKFQCDSCKIGLLDLGNVYFDITKPSETELAIKRFSAARDKSSIKAEGYWRYENQKSSSEFSGTLKTKDVEHEIEKLGFASVVKESGATVDFSLNWPDAPFQFSIKQLNGDLHTRLDDGYLADVSDKGARIFSVLSLQSLVRKLKLDFRDIFSDGMFYSQIKGDFHLNKGVLYTNNTKMDGAAGDLTVKGNTNLSRGVLDYRMTYKPNLTSSLPVLAWIATLNPVSILAGFALDEVLTSKVVSEFNFELTGNVNDPNLREVNRKNRNISVGRSSPPKFVDNANEHIDKQESQQPFSELKQPKPSSIKKSIAPKKELKEKQG